MNEPIPVKWLDAAPTHSTGVAFGVPWSRGDLRKDVPVVLRRSTGEALPTQTWPLAYWPDGSIKWLALSAVVGPQDGDRFIVARGEAPQPARPVKIQQIGIEIFKRVDTGAMVCDVGDRGIYVIQAIERDGRVACGGVRLVSRREQRRREHGREVRQTSESFGVIKKLTVEQAGPVRGVIKLEGVHRDDADGREWLPFVLRLVFYAGLDTVRMMHTFIYDGRAEEDFVAGLGVRCHVPLADGPHNRHVRFAGESGGVWIEPVRYHYMNAGPKEHLTQLRAEALTPPASGGMLPDWSDFQLWQDSADHCVVRKRLGDYGCWVDSAHANRAPGAAALSEPGGGLMLGVRDFWQSCPTALQVDGAAGPEPHLTAWLWAPDSPPMDMRHYGHRDYRPVYEAVNPDPGIYSSPYGVGRTSELVLAALPASTSNDEFAARAGLVSAPLLVCEPEHYHRCRMFGPWSLPDRGTPRKAEIEAHLDRQIDYCREEVARQRWYGFWHYGDVRHSYDHERHVWRYDIGGAAWNNAELAFDLFLWHTFLRTGRGDAFRLAEAMTRHVSEVDSYHLGQWAPLGTRHNVVHWGCPCKEPRVSVANPKRIMYYLTADERTGDLLWEVTAADRTNATNTPNDPAVTMARIGPTWTAYAAAWLTAWERSGDIRWRDRILTGIEGILAAPCRLYTGNPFHYDPATGAMRHSEEWSFGNGLVLYFGGAELWLELIGLLDHPGFRDAVIEYAEVHALSPDELRRRLSAEQAAKIDSGWPALRLLAYAAAQRRDHDLARRVWALLFKDHRSNPGQAKRDLQTPPTIQVPTPCPDLIPITWGTARESLSGRSLVESDWATIHTAQWGLMAIECLELIGHAVEDSAVE